MSTPLQQPSVRQAGGLKQLGLALVFVAFVACIFFFRDYLSGPQKEVVDTKDAFARYGLLLQEVAKQSGIDFKHRPPVLDAKLDHIMPIIASMGAGVAVADFDRDGWPDLYTVNSAAGSKNALYRNRKDGTFEDVAEEMGVADLNRSGEGACMGAVWGDYDNDGFEDLFVYRWGRPELFRNDRGKRFTRVSDKAGLPAWVNANSAIWLDYNRDGLLDLFIAGYWADDINLWNLKHTQIMPESFQYANNGGRKYLLHNKGDGTFEDVAEKLGIRSTRWTLAVAASDLRGTGYPDIVLANDYGVNEVYANQNGKGFIEIGEDLEIGKHSKSGMSVALGDIYNNGRQAIYVSNISEPGILLQGNNLWVPDPGKTGEHLHYTNLAHTLGVDLGGWSWGAQFGDLNNDGMTDLFLTNGYISGDRKKSYWYDYSRIAGANREIIIDAKHWPAMHGRSLAGYQQKCVWLNRNGKFIDCAQAIGANDTFDGRAVALVDLWNRGVLDVVLANQNGPLQIYKNTTAPENGWIQFELEGAKSNKSAIGAQVRLFWGKNVQLQEVSGGSGYASQNQRRLHFGLGKAAVVDRVEVRWPSGQAQIIAAPEIGRVHRLTEAP